MNSRFSERPCLNKVTSIDRRQIRTSGLPTICLHAYMHTCRETTQPELGTWGHSSVEEHVWLSRGRLHPEHSKIKMPVGLWLIKNMDSIFFTLNPNSMLLGWYSFKILD